MIRSKILTALAAASLMLAGCAKAEQQQQPAQVPKDVDAAFGEKVRAYLMNHPEVLRDALIQLDRNDKLAEVQQRLAEQVPYLPLLTGTQVAITRDGVEGADKTLDASFKFRFTSLSKK